MILNEGMRPLDLSGYISNLISVDEYKSKISNESLVMGFYATNKEAATDFSRFVQKSSADILDTEVGSAPDMKGRYLVFVEVINDSQAGKNLVKLFKELAELVGFDQWKFRTRGEVETVNIPDVPSYLAKRQARRVNECLSTSSITTDGGNLLIEGTGIRVIEWGNVTDLCQRLGMGLATTHSYEQARVVLEACGLFGDSVDIVATTNCLMVVNESSGFSAALI